MTVPIRLIIVGRGNVMYLWHLRASVIRFGHNARLGHGSCPSVSRPPARRNESKHIQEVPIRTFGVGLMAIAAVAAGLVLSRTRPSRDEVKAPVGESLLSLEALRAAGM